MSNEIDIICVGIGWNRDLKQIPHLLNFMPDTVLPVKGGYKESEMVED